MAKTFNERVWALTKKIPKGNVSTYKLLAHAAGTKAYRAVGNAMNKNPNGIMNCKGKNMVPCHRVVDSKGNLHGFAHGLEIKANLLKKEGVKVRNNKIEDFDEILFKFL